MGKNGGRAAFPLARRSVRAGATTAHSAAPRDLNGSSGFESDRIARSVPP